MDPRRLSANRSPKREIDEDEERFHTLEKTRTHQMNFKVAIFAGGFDFWMAFTTDILKDAAIIFPSLLNLFCESQQPELAVKRLPTSHEDERSPPPAALRHHCLSIHEGMEDAHCGPASSRNRGKIRGQECV